MILPEGLKLVRAWEVSKLLPGARAFFAEGAIVGDINEDHFCNTLQSLIEREQCICITTDEYDGAIAGMLYPDLATGKMRCMEYFWFVHPDKRGKLGIKLLKALEQMAKAVGADHLIMAHLATETTEPLKRLYTKRNYQMREQLFYKDLRDTE